jgi:hypothetical protein
VHSNPPRVKSIIAERPPKWAVICLYMKGKADPSFETAVGMHGSMMPGRFTDRTVRHNVASRGRVGMGPPAAESGTESTKAFRSVLIARLRGTRPLAPAAPAPRAEPRQLGLSLPLHFLLQLRGLPFDSKASNTPRP